MELLSKTLLTSLIAVLFLLPEAASAQHVQEGAGPSEKVDTSFDHWRDETGQAVIKDVLDLEQSQWTRAESGKATLGISELPHWMKFTVRNSTSKTGYYIVDLGYAQLDNVRFYVFQNGKKIREFTTGDAHPFFPRDVAHPSMLLRISLEPQQAKTVYAKIQTNGSVVLPLRVWPENKFFEAAAQEEKLHFFYYGALSFMVLINLAIFFTLRERVYLFYSLAITGYLLFFGSMSGYAFQHFYPESPTIHGRMILLSMPFLAVFSLLFCREFLRTQGNSPKLDLALRIVLYLEAINLVLAFLLDYNTSLKISTVLAFVFFPLLLFAGPIRWAAGIRAGAFFTIAWTPLTVGIFATGGRATGLLPESFFAEHAMQIGSGLEAFVLTLALADRLYREREDKIKAQAESLRKGQELLLHEQRELESSKQYATKLESEVKRRTNELEESLKEVEELNEVIGSAQGETVKYLNKIQALLNNSGEGFLSVGSDLRVEQGYSRECQHLFEQSDLEGKSVARLLSPADAETRELIEGALDEVLNKGVPHSMIETYLSLLPSSFELGSRRCEARYRLLPDKKRLMIVLNDITHKEELKRRIEDERIQLKRTVYAVTQRDEFMQIMSDFEKFLDRDIREESAREGVERVSVDLHRQLHTFKSLFAQASCMRLAQVLHEREDALRELKGGGRSATPEALLENLNRPLLRATLEEELAPLERELGEDFFDQGRCFSVPDELVSQLEAQVKSLTGARSDLLRLVQTIRFEPLHSMLMSHIHMAHNLASQMGKRLKPTIISGPNPRLDPSVWGEPLRVLVHLFRNAVDHGIETPDERIAEDKPEQARLECWVEVDENTLRLYIEDDGRGLNVSVLRDRAVEKGVISAEEVAALSDEQTMKLIFEEGFSSRDKVNSLSGRGVGLAAVKDVIEKHAGTISVRSNDDIGTAFLVVLPFPSTDRVKNVLESEAYGFS